MLVLELHLLYETLNKNPIIFYYFFLLSLSFSSQVYITVALSMENWVHMENLNDTHV